MKILHVETGKHLYGGAKQVLYLMQGLHASDVENILICANTSEIAKQATPFANVYAVPMSGDLDIGFIFRLQKLINQHQPDLIHLHSRRGADWLGGIAAKLTNTPCILSRRVDNPESRFITGLKYRLFDKVVAISQAIGNVLLGQGLPPQQLKVIHSAVATAEYDKSYNRQRLLDAFKLPADAITIGVIAQLIPRKGHRFVLEVLPELLKTHPQLRVLFFGQGPMQDELTQAIDDAQLNHAVQLTGFRTDLTELIGSLDMVVHPALMEGLGVSLLQAGAAGVPLIGSNAGGIPEIVLNGNTGILIEPADTTALKQAVDQLASDPSLRQQMGANAKTHIKDVFSVDTMVAKNLAHYGEVLRGLTC